MRSAHHPVFHILHDLYVTLYDVYVCGAYAHNCVHVYVYTPFPAHVVARAGHRVSFSTVL